MFTGPDRSVLNRRAGQRLRAVWVACALGGLSQSLGGSAGALLAQQAGHSGAVAGLPQTMLVIGAALSALGLSEMTRRYGRGVSLSLGALTAAAGCIVVVLGGLAMTLTWILVGSLLFGAGNTAVMLGRYAAADLARESDRARAMASVLVATTVGAVAGPNLLAPAGALAAALDVPVLVGPYLVAVAGFVAAAIVLAMGLGITATDRTPPEPGSTVSRPLARKGVAGLAILGVANLVMVAVMTMAPVHLHHHGASLGLIGLVVSAHIAGMFVPSPISGWLTERLGALRVARLSGVTLAVACGLAAVAASPVVLALALVLVGVGWNLGLVSGSVLLTAHVPEVLRPRREGWGEVSMGAAAASGGAASGVLATNSGYPALAAATGALAVLFALLVGWPLSRARRTASREQISLGGQVEHAVPVRPDEYEAAAVGMGAGTTERRLRDPRRIQRLFGERPFP
jgi:MFS family permease